jgi:tetratricopeptide (TPR) repeat protein
MEDERAATTIEGPLQHKIESMIRGMGDSSPESSDNVNVYQSIAKAYQGDVLGSEALFHLAEHYELRGNSARAIQVYADVTRRTGVIAHDPWPLATGLHLTSILKPQLEAALKSKKDVQVLTLFHSHGQAPEQHYIGTQTLLEVADTHRRLGFSTEAVHLYQMLVRNRKAAALHEEALLGLGESYLDQLDPSAARNVFESFRLQYPRSARSTQVAQQLTTAMLEQGDRQSAIRVMRQWLHFHPRDATQGWIFVKLARTLAEDQKPQAAAAVFEDALRNNVLRAPQDLLLYADLLMKLNMPERAVDLYRQLLKAGPSLAEAEWARVQIMLNPEAKNRTGPSSTVVETDQDFGDPLLHRAAAAMQTALRATMEKEGG